MKTVYLLPLLFLVLIVDVKTMIQEDLSFGRGNDFAHYYITSKRVLGGENPYATPLESDYERYGLENSPKIPVATNPPALALTFLPFALLPPLTAALGWLFFQLILLYCCLKILPLLSPQTVQRKEQILFAAAALVMYPTVAGLLYNQAQLLVLTCLLLGVLFCQREKPVLGGVMWGYATALKLFTWPLFLWFLARRDWRGVVGFLIGLFCFTAPIFFFDGSLLSDFYGSAIPFVEQSLSRFNGSNSIPGALFYTLQTFGVSAEEHLGWINPLALGLLLICCWLVLRQRFDLVTSVSLLIIGSLLFSPTTWNHYLVLLIFPLYQIYQRVCTTDWVIAYMLVALSQGYLSSADQVWQLVSAWWGVVGMGYLSFLLWRESVKVPKEKELSTGKSRAL